MGAEQRVPACIGPTINTELLQNNRIPFRLLPKDIIQTYKKTESQKTQFFKRILTKCCYLMFQNNKIKMENDKEGNTTKVL